MVTAVSFHLVPVKQDKETVAAGYAHPHEGFPRQNASETGESAYLTINPLTGDLIWDSPVVAGVYNVAI